MGAHPVSNIDLSRRQMTLPIVPELLAVSVARLAAWLETIRCNDGYGGPVVHWWRDCLLYAGAGLDWRYEGLIAGYIKLHQITGDAIWLKRARRAGDDLVAGQLPDGTFRCSNFELNPYAGGTPHEASCALALLGLRAYLFENQEPGGDVYGTAAERYLKGYMITHLWDAGRRRFQDGPCNPLFVPNKAATAAEALIAYAVQSGELSLLERFVQPTLDAVLAAQQHDTDLRLNGAIAQVVTAHPADDRFFPLYISRCIPSLLLAHTHTGETRYLTSARAAGNFLRRVRLADGLFPQILYRRGSVYCDLRWIAGAGEILRVLELLRQYEDVPFDAAPTLRWILAGQLPSGGIMTARSSSRFGARSATMLPAARDLLPVCGWVDKSFRLLCALLPPCTILPKIVLEDVRMPCVVGGRIAEFVETDRELTIWQGRRLLYQWLKGTKWAYAAASL